MAEGAVSAIRARRAGARRRRRGAARCGPRAGQCPGGGAARKRSGVKEATATVDEEGEPEKRAGPTGPRGGAARRGPRAGETPGGGAARPQSGAQTGLARGPAREDQIRHEERS